DYHGAGGAISTDAGSTLTVGHSTFTGNQATAALGNPAAGVPGLQGIGSRGAIEGKGGSPPAPAPSTLPPHPAPRRPHPPPPPPPPGPRAPPPPPPMTAARPRAAPCTPRPRARSLRPPSPR